MTPPFKLTPRILSFIEEIGRLLGKYEGFHSPTPQPKLRRQNRIKTIQGSLAIEGNTLGLEQVTAIFDEKRVLGPKKDILEVQNAIRLYDGWRKYNPASSKDLLTAHQILMAGLTPDAGKFRSGAVGILKGSKVSHIAPPSKLVNRLMGDLLDFLKTEQELSPLIKACVFHYELEFIHPFSDGNGRIGRFWQQLILTRHHGVFEHLPVESLVRERQAKYYRALEQSDQSGDCTKFIEFSLETIIEALKEFLGELKPAAESPQSRLDLARSQYSKREFTRKDYLRLFVNISTATASRDLAFGCSTGDLQRSGTKALAKYRFIR